MIDNKGDITACTLGAKGSGKSVKLADTLNRSSTGGVLFDMLGVFNPRNNYKTAVVPGSYYCLSPNDYLENIDKFPKNSKVIIDFSWFFGDDLIEQVDKVSRSLMSRQVPTMVLSDEVADFMPNNARGSKEFHLMVKNGRNFGLKPIEFATQRPQSVDKKIFDLCDNFYISMQRAPRTIEYIMDLVDMKGNNEFKKRISTLEQGTFLKYNGMELKDMTVGKYPYAFKQ